MEIIIGILVALLIVAGFALRNLVKKKRNIRRFYIKAK